MLSIYENNDNLYVCIYKYVYVYEFRCSKFQIKMAHSPSNSPTAHISIFTIFGWPKLIGFFFLNSVCASASSHFIDFKRSTEYVALAKLNEINRLRFTFVFFKQFFPTFFSFEMNEAVFHFRSDTFYSFICSIPSEFPHDLGSMRLHSLLVHFLLYFHLIWIDGDLQNDS